MKQTIWVGIVNQLLFAAACFALTLAIKRRQMQEKG